MSTQYITEEGQNFQQAPEKPKRKMPWLLIALTVVALFIGAGSGYASGSSKIPDTVEVEKVVEKKVNVEVPTTPDSCMQALGFAQDVISSAGRALEYSNDNLKAVVDFDADRIKANTAKTEAETAVLEELGPKFQLSRDECLATSK